MDAYTEQLSKSLATLQKIVDERQEIEKELKSRLWKQLQSQVRNFLGIYRKTCILHALVTYFLPVEEK